MTWFKGGVIGIVVGLLIEIIIFLIAHVCQIFLGSLSRVCPVFVLPVSLFANFLPLSIRVNYLIVMGIYLILFGIIGIIIFRKR